MGDKDDDKGKKKKDPFKPKPFVPKPFTAPPFVPTPIVRHSFVPNNPTRTPTASGHGGNNSRPYIPYGAPAYSGGEGDSYRPRNSPELASARQTAFDSLPANYDDIGGGLTPYEIWRLQQEQDRGGSGSGSGSGALAGATPETIAAYQQMLTALDAQGANENASFDQYGMSLTEQNAAGDTRLQGLLQRLAESRMASQGASRSSFGNTDADLQGLAAQYGQQSQLRNDGVNRSLAAFGVGPEQGEGQAIQDMLMASREQNARLGGASDIAYVNRGNVANALGADAVGRNSQQFSQLQQQLAAQRQAAVIAQAQRRAQLAMQAAASGVTLAPPAANGGLPFSG